MNETQITMIGNAVEDPVLRFGKSGQPFVTFRLASTVRRLNASTGQFADAGTNFVTVLGFRQLARNVAQSIRKGQPVVVTGRLRVNQWTSGDRTGTSVEIDATGVGHDLSRGIAEFTRVKTGAFGEGSFPVQDVAGAGLRLAATEGQQGTAEAGSEPPYGPEQEPDPAYEHDARYDDPNAPLPPYEEEVSEAPPYGVRDDRLGA